MAEYTIQKPVRPQALRLLAGLVGVGLVALYLAAYHAFVHVAPWYQALFAAALIEAGMIVESIALIRRNWLSLPGALVSLVVSGTYNYIQAEQAGRLSGLTDSWQLFSLAIGPLSALFFLALAYGHELRRYEQDVSGWESERQKWIDEQELRRQQAREKAEQLRIEREVRIAQAEAERERMRIELEQKAEMDRLKLEMREKRRQERLAHQQSATGMPGEEMARRGTYEDFASTQAARQDGTPMSAGEIERAFGVPRRTAYNWLARYSTRVRSNGHNHN